MSGLALFQLECKLCWKVVGFWEEKKRFGLGKKGIAVLGGERSIYRRGLEPRVRVLTLVVFSLTYCPSAEIKSQHNEW